MPIKRDYQKYISEGKCSNCGGVLDTLELKCNKCKDKHKKAQRNYKIKMKEQNRCTHCGIDLSIFSDINTAKTKCPMCSEYKPLW